MEESPAWFIVVVAVSDLILAVLIVVVIVVEDIFAGFRTVLLHCHLTPPLGRDCRQVRCPPTLAMVKDMWLVPGYKDTGEVDTVTLGLQGGDINGALYGSG